jgi:hypothetical protein
MNLKEYLSHHNIKPKPKTPYSLTISKLVENGLEGFTFTIEETLKQEIPKRCRYKVNSLKVSGSDICNAIQFTDNQVIILASQIEVMNVGDKITFSNIRKDTHSKGIIFDVAIDNSKTQPTIKEEQEEVTETKVEIKEEEIMKITPEVFNTFSLDKKKELVKRMGNFVRNQVCINPSGNKEQPFRNFNVEINDEGKYGANKIVAFANICINQSLHPHNLEAYKLFYKLFYDYFLELDDLVINSIDKSAKEKTIDTRYEVFKSTYKKVKGSLPS